jgi:hypothetical protein
LFARAVPLIALLNAWWSFRFLQPQPSHQKQRGSVPAAAAPVKGVQQRAGFDGSTVLRSTVLQRHARGSVQ